MSSLYPEDAPSQENQDESGLNSWLAELQQERLDNWRREALEKHPQLQSIREYLTANTKAEVMALADDLAEKLGGNEEPTRSPSVTGGSPSLSGTRHPGDDSYTIEDAVDELRQTRNHDAVGEKWIRARLDEAGVAPLYDN